MSVPEPLLSPPPAEPLLPPPPSEPLLPGPQPAPAPQPMASQTPGVAPKKSPKRHLWRWIVGGILLLIIVIIVVVIGLFRYELSAVSPDAKQLVLVEVKQGMTPPEIGQLLQDKKVIRNETAFDLYTRLSRSRSNLQAGTYRLSPADSTPEIVTHLEQGKVATFTLTFKNGGTLKDVLLALEKAGYSETDINKAFAATYSSPILADKPAGATLEGYVLGDTYKISSGATPEDIIQTAIDTLNDKITANDLIPQFTSRGFSTYQAIIFASIIQAEDDNPANQRQIAAVFYNRLAIGMSLDSDATFRYGASLLGVTPSPSVDSPYNTYKITGLPPGPIANPSLTALMAVAQPGSNDDLFFISGDDGTLHLAKTQAEQDQNVQQYCQKKCLQEGI